MRVRPPGNHVLERVQITGIAAEGKALAKVDGLVLFVKGAVPGDVADVKIVKKKKNFCEGEAIKIHSPGAGRAVPFCKHFGTCGGCSWQFLDYNEQLFWKEKQVREQFERIGNIRFSTSERGTFQSDATLFPILASPVTIHYRNKLEYTFSTMKWLTDEELKMQFATGDKPALGFHIPGRFDKVLDIEECFLQPSPSNEIRLEVKKFALDNRISFYDLRKQQGLLRNLTIRTATNGELMIIFSFFYDDPVRNRLLDHLKSAFPQITSLMYVINSKRNDSINDLSVHCYFGADHLTEYLGDLKLRVGPKSFFQTNSLQVLRLYDTIKSFGEFHGHETVYDLYTGTGTIANYIARNVKKVIGVDFIPEAISDANENSRINTITNTKFLSGDIKEILTEDFVTLQGKPHLIITDPPRAGMHPDVVKKIRLLSPDKIIYVSCNPATQARDIALLSNNYRLEKVQPVDMFPHTQHVECITLLVKKQSVL